MLSASKCRGKANFGIAVLIRFAYPNIRNTHNLNYLGAPLYAKKLSWGFSELSANGFVSRNSHFTSCIKSFPVGVPWMWPFFTIVRNSIDDCKYFTTQTFPSEEESIDEILNHILSEIENSPISTQEICASHIDKLCKARNLSAAARLLQSLHDKQIYLGPESLNLLLAAAGEENDADLASQVFKDLLVFGRSLTSDSYHNLARAFATTSDSFSVLRFVKEVSELIFPRGATILNRTIFAFAECGQVDKALLIFDHMKSMKYKADLITYNTILAILGKASRIDEMLQEFTSMKECNIIPDIVSYNTLLNSLRKVGRLDLCSLVLKEMNERGVEPDLRTYKALIESFGRSGNIEESLRLFDEMKHRQIRPSIYIYRSLINNLKKLGKLDLAMTFLKEMNSCFSDLIGPKDFKRRKR